MSLLLHAAVKRWLAVTAPPYHLLALIGYSGLDKIHAGNPTTLILVSRVMLLLILL